MRLKNLILSGFAAVSLLTGCDTISPNATWLGGAHGQSMFNRANELWNGNQYMPPDRREAIHCFIMSAQQGNTDAMMILGDFCENGRLPLVYPKASEAFDWYYRAALAGDTRGMAKLACFYANGVGVQKNSPECFRWVKQLAQANDPMAVVVMGEFYENGYGVTADKAQAIACYKSAAKSDSAQAVARANQHLHPEVKKENQEANEQFQSAALVFLGAIALESMMGSSGGGNYDADDANDTNRRLANLRDQRNQDEAEAQQREIENQRAVQAQQQLMNKGW